MVRKLNLSPQNHATCSKQSSGQSKIRILDNEGKPQIKDQATTGLPLKKYIFKKRFSFYEWLFKLLYLQWVFVPLRNA